MELNDSKLDTIAGGKIIETENGKWVVVPEDTMEFANEERAIGAWRVMAKNEPDKYRRPYKMVKVGCGKDWMIQPLFSQDENIKR